jgi:hypothetical protein
MVVKKKTLLRQILRKNEITLADLNSQMEEDLDPRIFHTKAFSESRLSRIVNGKLESRIGAYFLILHSLNNLIRKKENIAADKYTLNDIVDKDDYRPVTKKEFIKRLRSK